MRTVTEAKMTGPREDENVALVAIAGAVVSEAVPAEAAWLGRESPVLSSSDASGGDVSLQQVDWVDHISKRDHSCCIDA